MTTNAGPDPLIGPDGPHLLSGVTPDSRRVRPGDLYAALPGASHHRALSAVRAERGVTAAAMEVSSHALTLGRVEGTSYDVAVFTNLSQDHLDFHAGMEEYFAAKARFFSRGYARVGVVNTDDGYGRRLAGIAEIPITTFSATGDPAADWRARAGRGGAGGPPVPPRGPGGVEA